MSVPKGKRNQSRFEAQHHFFQLRADITDLILNDFGFSPEKYAAKMEKYKENHMNSPNLDGVLQRWEKKNESFSAWFVDEEAREILHLLREIERNFTMGNSIYPGEGPSKLFEFIERRKYINRAIGLCYTLKQEINYAPIMSKKQIKHMKSLYQELFGKELRWKPQPLSSKTAPKSKQKSTATT